MSDLISRQALCEYALNQKDKAVTPNDIMRFPSVKPKMGKWLMRDGVYGATYCSECNYELRINDVNYCPNCGKRMLG